MQPWYYDAAGIISAKDTISMEHEFGLFASVIVAFYRCSEQQWGRLDIVGPDSFPSTPSAFPFRTLEGGTVHVGNAQIVFEGQIHCQHALVGRRTAVYGATVKQLGKPDRPGVIKISYQVTTRRPEWEFIQEGHNRQVKHLPEVITYQDFARFSDGVWGALFPANSDMYEDRVLRMIVFPRYTPIYEVINANNFTTVLRQLVDCEQIY